MKWIKRNSLWLVGLGLMLASSGLDGVYMARWMPAGLWWLGLILNTTADCASMAIAYWYGRLQYSEKKRAPSYVLLAGEAVAVAYSWFFSWRQLRFVLPAVEAADWQWVSWVAAGYIPLLLAFVGYAQSLMATRSATKKTTSESQPAQSEPAPLPLFVCEVCDRPFSSQPALNAHQRKHKNGNGSKQAASPDPATIQGKSN